MATYNGLAENIYKTNFDNHKILKDLEQLETTITHLKSYPPTELSDEIKTKIHLLVTSFQVLQSRLFRTAIDSKTLDELWEGNGMLKYLFEKCIKHYAVNDRLKCVTCDEWLQVSRVVLKNHLEGSKHIQCFSENMHRDMVSYWKDIVSHFSSTEGETEEDFNIDDDKCLMLKYGRFIDFDGPNDMLFCKLCCIIIPKNINNLQAHFKDSLHQELFKEVVNVIVDRTKNNVEKTKNKNIFIENEPNSLPSLSFNNLHSSSDTPNQSTNESRGDMESWFKDTIDKFVIELLEDESSCDKLYICSVCQFRTTSLERWREHCFSVRHETRMQMCSNVLYYPCNCSTEMICPNYIREYHMKMNHHRVLDLFDALKSKKVKSDTTLFRQPLDVLSDDDNASSDDDNNNNSDCGSNSNVKNDDLKSYLNSKISNHVENSGVKPKIPKGVNATGVEKKSIPPKSAARKPARIIGENDNSAAQNGNATPIGLSDIPENTSNDDLVKVIQHFGSIIKIERVRPSFANVYIELREEFQSILYLGLTVTVKGSVVRITDPILQSSNDVCANDVSTPKSTPCAKTTPQSILLKFSNELDFMKLVLDVLKRAKLVCNDAESVRIDLINAISCPVAIVGSKALTLAIDTSSTLDLFISIDDNYFGKKSEVNAVELSTRTIKLFDTLKKAENFKNVEIVGDNVQVLKLLHKNTDMKCQIFCNDGLIVEKTLLSNIYLNSDPNLRCMVLAILEWFNGVGLRNVLSAYSILWMALFSLMQCSYLYPVIVLRNYNESGRKMISGWDCRYSSTYNPKMSELPSVHELVGKFFEFYSDPSNFEKKVLAPLTGEKFDHIRIRQKKLPPPYGRYCHLVNINSVRFFKLTHGICLQDPLQLNYNLTKSLQGKSLNKFVAYCKDTLRCFNH